MNINDFLPDKVCINLDRRPARWEQAQSQFALHRIDSVRRFAAVDGTRLEVPSGWNASAGAYGCLQSHLAVVREARQSGFSRILILEDDVIFDSDFNSKFSQYVEQLPDDWEMLLFGGLHLLIHPEKISDNVCRLTHSYSTFAYALKETVYHAFIELNSRSLEPVDKNNAVLQQSFKGYCFMPPLAWVEESYSDTENKVLNPWYVKEGIVIASPELGRIQKQCVVIIAHQDSTSDGGRTRNLKFKLDYYLKWYPDISLLVVEQGERPTFEPQSLREGVDYEMLRDGGPFDPGRCFQVGLEKFESGKEFFVFTESDIHLDRENVVANLELCLRYDFVSSFRTIIDLSEEDTRRLINGEDIDLSAYRRGERTNICAGSCFFTRAGIRKIGGWRAEKEDPQAELQSLKVKRMLSGFESPNVALRLSSSFTEKFE